MSHARTLGLAAAGLAAGLAFAAEAHAFGRGGAGGNNGAGDYALRAELQNQQFIQPGTPYPYPRSYARGPIGGGGWDVEGYPYRQYREFRGAGHDDGYGYAPRRSYRGY